MAVARNAALIALGAVGTVFAMNQIAKPSSTQSMATNMRRELSEYNATVHPEQDRSDTIFDRTAIMENVKARKPWNKTYAESTRARNE